MVSIPSGVQVNTSPEKIFVIQNAPWSDHWQSFWFENLVVFNGDNAAYVGLWISQISKFPNFQSCNM